MTEVFETSPCEAVPRRSPFSISPEGVFLQLTRGDVLTSFWMFGQGQVEGGLSSVVFLLTDTPHFLVGCPMLELRLFVSFALLPEDNKFSDVFFTVFCLGVCCRPARYWIAPAISLLRFTVFFAMLLAQAIVMKAASPPLVCLSASSPIEADALLPPPRNSLLLSSSQIMLGEFRIILSR